MLVFSVYDYVDSKLQKAKKKKKSQTILEIVFNSQPILPKFGGFSVSCVPPALQNPYIKFWSENLLDFFSSEQPLPTWETYYSSIFFDFDLYSTCSWMKYMSYQRVS